MQYLKNINSKEVHKLEKVSSARCNLSINETEVKAKVKHIGRGKFKILTDEKAKVKHIGRGKFKILTDENGGEYTNVILDASDVFHCKQMC
jgi:hypothetical protein